MSFMKGSRTFMKSTSTTAIGVGSGIGSGGVGASGRAPRRIHGASLELQEVFQEEIVTFLRPLRLTPSERIDLEPSLAALIQTLDEEAPKVIETPKKLGMWRNLYNKTLSFLRIR